MEIKNAKYMQSRIEKENIGITATIDGEDITVPLDPNNRHYIEILKQVKEGTLTIKDAD
tara:strand:+ start:453 stop:629 length:177 start_codon:yes stop_codon:yes gene_type:complete